MGRGACGSESGGSSGAKKKELASTAKLRHVGGRQFPLSRGVKLSGPLDSLLPPIECHLSTGKSSGSDSEDPSDAEDDDSEVDRRQVGGRQFPLSRGVKFSGPLDSLLPPHMSSHHSLSNDVGYDSDSDIDEMKNIHMPMPSSLLFRAGKCISQANNNNVKFSSLFYVLKTFMHSCIWYIEFLAPTPAPFGSPTPATPFGALAAAPTAFGAPGKSLDSCANITSAPAFGGKIQLNVHCQDPSQIS